MSTSRAFRFSQGELFSSPAKLPDVSLEVRQRMVQLLARMMNDYLDRCPHLIGEEEVGDE